ncbi:MAG: hypothetical protein IT453_03815 [Planctomycetes bacterium]|nr:hypothetical protein [Planctomycetota bacterium]
MADTTHPHGLQPERPDSTVVWRYMTVAKLLSLVETSELFYSATQNFSDPYEDSATHAEIALDAERIRAGAARGDVVGYVEHSDPGGMCLVSCWCQQECESRLLWAEYGALGNSVAIQTSYRRLVAATPDCDLIAFVKYVDFATELRSEFNRFETVFRKRREFRDEHEVRLVRWIGPQVDSVSVMQRTGPPIEVPWSDPSLRSWRTGRNPKIGMHVAVDVEHLVERIVTHPDMPPFEEEALRSYLGRVGLAGRLKASSLAGRPVARLSPVSAAHAKWMEKLGRGNEVRPLEALDQQLRDSGITRTS